MSREILETSKSNFSLLPLLIVALIVGLGGGLSACGLASDFAIISQLFGLR